MQRLILSFTFMMLLTICFGDLTAYAQNRTNNLRPYKFDEYVDGAVMDSRLKRFAQQLKREPNTQAYIIAYSARRRRYNDTTAEDLLHWARQLLEDPWGIKPSRIVTVDGGIREEATTELWILPHGAPKPIARPSAQPSEVVFCPHVSVNGEIYALRRDKPLEFRATVNNGDPSASPSYNWTVSHGRITSGQGTHTVIVKPDEQDDKSVTANVEVGGLAEECSNKASATTVVGIIPYKVFELEEFGGEGLQIRLDYLAGFLLNEPSLLGYIIVYGGRYEKRSEVQFRLDSSRDYLVNSRGITPDRFRVVKGGYREKTTIEIWLSTRDKPAPVPTPTVDEKYVTFRRGKPRV